MRLQSSLRLFAAVLGVAAILVMSMAAQQQPGKPGPAGTAASHEHTGSPGGASALPAILPRNEEVALAEIAGPASIAKDAAIYVLERGKGYAMAREGKNGFACFVNRDRAETLEPVCLDPEGVATILPVYFERAKLREEGMDRDAIQREINLGFSSGKFRAPRRAGISYMLYNENRVPAGGRVITYPSHVMIFAPYVKNSDIGADMKDPWMPWVLNPGTPQAYIIVRTGGSQPSGNAQR